MRIVLLTNWWSALEGVLQLYWSTAIISSMLLVILIALEFIDKDDDEQKEEEKEKRKGFYLDVPRATLVFFSAAGWAGVIGSYILYNPKTIFILAISIGALGVIIPKLISYFFPRFSRFEKFDVKNAIETTGEVLVMIPPHRNGFGKVHLNNSSAPYKLDAITAGKELRPGEPIRVVEVIDERILVVESIESPGKPVR